jgi:hypothetical protein
LSLKLQMIGHSCKLFFFLDWVSNSSLKISFVLTFD